MSGTPSHKVFVVEERDEGESTDENDKPFWTRVGAAWPHKDGKGFNIQLASGIAVSGRVVLREYTEQDVKEEERKPKRKR